MERRARWLRRVGIGLIGVGALVTAFLVGMLVSERDLPPRGTVLTLHRELRGLLLDRERGGGHPEGKWRSVEEIEGAVGDLSDEQKEAIGRLESLGYLSGSRPPEESGGISHYDPERASAGLNLVVSGHAPEALLTDMEGKVLHRWAYDYWSAYPGTDVPRTLEGVQYWRRARLLENGDLLAIFEGHGLIRLDRSSNLVWAADIGAHHDLDLDADGRIFVLTRKVGILPRISPTTPVLEDFVTILDSDGTVQSEFSLLEAFESSVHASHLIQTGHVEDLLHTNTLQILDGSHVHRSPHFARGNLLISSLQLDTIAIVDPALRRVVWSLSGMWRNQHEPALLDNGNMLVFDNLGRGGLSKVVEIDPLTQEIVWLYEGSGEGRFFTEWCGSSQRLPNGNTLITESEAGRAFEVTPSGETVWKYTSPYRAGREGELVATLLEIVRLPTGAAAGWVGDS